ncbi:PREDICTED: uncharacterized protein LOC106147002 [Chinchilla lanigera]|uniref:uncharacterized protein LOC106147002 n=1 Tax=Chinchilla lanigera TaxID=34839 RepID=UPI000695C0FE|nr:PREDICTED: uncharacterized protein LOC106147002 [Chinchilla lanigera]
MRDTALLSAQSVHGPSERLGTARQHLEAGGTAAPLHHCCGSQAPPSGPSIRERLWLPLQPSEHRHLAGRAESPYTLDPCPGTQGELRKEGCGPGVFPEQSGGPWDDVAARAPRPHREGPCGDHSLQLEAPPCDLRPSRHTEMNFSRINGRAPTLQDEPLLSRHRRPSGCCGTGTSKALGTGTLALPFSGAWVGVVRWLCGVPARRHMADKPGAGALRLDSTVSHGATP